METRAPTSDQETRRAAPVLRVDVLGPLRIVVDGDERPFPAGRPGRLLGALLLARGRVLSVGSLVEAVWPDDPPADTRAALHTTVRRARHSLGAAAGRLVHQGNGYRLDREGLVTDADELVEMAARTSTERVDLPELDRVLAQWRGDPWADLADDLARAESGRLRDCRRRLREWRAQALAGAGRHADAVAELTSLVADDPLAEGPVALLVEVLDEQGDVAGALAAYDDYRRRLAEALGLDPSPRLVELQRRVLRREHRRPQASRPVAPDRPLPPRTLHGREAQLQSLARLLAPGRCVTLVGPGGVGKTSIAARVAQDHDVVWWVDLTRVAPGEDVLPAVAEVLGVVAAEGGSLHAATLGALARTQGLLVLDNCEHVVPVVADLVDAALRGAAHLTMLATSRERLDVDGEQVLPLPPLQLPARDHPDDDALRSSPSVALFLERAGAVAPDAVGPEELRLVADIVWRLDGLPLAIGLAAGRAGALTLTDLRDRLLEHLDELRTASRRAHPRQRTLVSTIAWSYDLLSDSEQEVFGGLSVFASEFDLDDVESVLGRAAVPVVADLVQRSLVTAVGDGAGPSRFVLLETLRAFARDTLDDVRRSRVRESHGRWAADLARRIDIGLTTTDELRWARIARRRLPDLAAAYHWSMASSDHAVARAVVYHLQRWAYYRVRPEVLAWATPLVATDAGPLVTAAAHAWMSGRAEEGMEHARRAVELGRRSEELEVAGRGAELLGDLLLGRGELEAALDAYAEAERLAASVGDAFDTLTALGGQLLALTWLGRPWEEVAARVEAGRDAMASPTARAMASYCLGEAWAGTDPARALALMQEAVTVADDVGSPLVVGVARTAATALAARTGLLDRADAAELAATLGFWLSAGNENLLLTSLRNTVLVLTRLHRHAEATELLAALDRSDGSWGEEAAALEASRTAAKAALGESSFGARWAVGAERSLQEAAEQARVSLTS